MTIAFRASSVTAATATSPLSPAQPTGTASTDISLLFVEVKQDVAGTPPSITTPPSGWTEIASAVNTGDNLASGTDVGTNYLWVYYRVGTFTAPSIPFSGGNNGGAAILTFSTTLGSWDVITTTTGVDSSVGANGSITGAAGIDLASGDMAVCGVGHPGDVGTMSAQTIGGASGVTWGTNVNQINLGVTSGNDSRLQVAYRPVSSGTSSTAPTYVWTNTSSLSGVARFVRLRDFLAPVTSALTATAVATATIGDTAGPSDNLLTGDASSFLTSLAGWVTAANGPNVTLEWSAENGGVQKWTVTTGGATITSASMSTGSLAKIPVTPGETILAGIRNHQVGGTLRTVRLEAHWYDATQSTAIATNPIATITGSQQTATTAPQLLEGSVVVPVDAAYMRLRATVVTPGAGEVFYWDDAYVRRSGPPTQQSTLLATATATATLSGFQTITQALSATVAATATLSGLQTASKALSATAAASATISAQQIVLQALVATAAASATLTAQRTAIQALTATALATASLSGLQTITSTLVATAVATASLTPLVTHSAVLTATAVATATVSSTTTASAALTATAAATASITPLVTALRALSATAAATASLSPLVTISRAFLADVVAVATLSGRVQQMSVLTATAQASATVSPLVAIPGALVASAVATAVFFEEAVRALLADAEASATLTAVQEVSGILLADAVASAVMNLDPILPPLTAPIAAAFRYDGVTVAAFVETGIGAAAFTYTDSRITAAFSEDGIGSAQFADTGVGAASYA